MRFTPSGGACYALASVVSGVLLLMTACSGSTPPGSSESPIGPASSVVPTPSPTVSPTPAVPSAGADAVARARTYIALVDTLSKDPKPDLDQLSTVARGEAADKWRRLLADDRLAGHRQTGTTTVNVLGAKAGSSDQQWSVSLCLDVSGVDVVDREGKSVVAKNRPDRVRDVLTLDQDTSSSKWYVTRDAVTDTC